MTIEVMTAVLLFFLLVTIVLNIVLLRKLSSLSQEQLGGKLEAFEKNLERVERSVTDQIAKNREETSVSDGRTREEINKTLAGLNEQMAKSFGEFSNMQKNQLDTFSQNLVNTGNGIEQRSIQTLQMIEANYEKIIEAIKEVNESNNRFLEAVRTQMQRMTESSREDFENIRGAIEAKLIQIQADNANKLVEIRGEVIAESRQMREETGKSLKAFSDSITLTMKNINETQNSRLKEFSGTLESLIKKNEDKFETLRNAMELKLNQIQADNSAKMVEIRKESRENTRVMREDMAASMKDFSANVSKTLGDMSVSHKENFDSIFKHINTMIETNSKKSEEIRNAVEEKLQHIQEDNTKKLEEMRKTVDEKLQSTLEKRLGESFNIVSQRLELVHKGLGEMRNLASGVGDLKKVLSNVKTRGTWGEIQLGNLLEQIMTPEQYEKNVKLRESSGEIVEYAVKLPGKSLKEGENVWIPIDAKFPQEMYVKLIEASEKGDVAGVDLAVRQLEAAIKKCAKDISEKYVNPPKTTDFAIMFLPVEGLYAEALRRTGLVEQLQREYRVIVTGPTTLAAVLNSLQMGFRTLAIEKRSSEVWNVLAAVKTEFNKFGDVIDKVHKKIQAAGNEIGNVSRRTRVIDRKLIDVQALPESDSSKLLSLPDDTDKENIALLMK